MYRVYVRYLPKAGNVIKYRTKLWAKFVLRVDAEQFVDKTRKENPYWQVWIAEPK